MSICLRSIRKIDQEISDGLSCLYNLSGFTLFGGNPTKSLLFGIMARGNVHLVVLIDNQNQAREKFVGMGLLVFNVLPAGGIVAEIHDIFVLEDYRGRKLGEKIVSRLIVFCKRLARAKRVPVKLSLTSKPKRKEANGLYLKLGFDLVAEAVGDRGTNLYKMFIDVSGSIKK